MPELPEVETIRRGLEKYVVGHTIETVEVNRPKIFQGDTKNVQGAKVVDVKRFGKGLVIDLSNTYSLAIHIKLTGQLIYKGKNESKAAKEPKGGDLSSQMIASGYDRKEGRVEVPSKATHVVFHLDKGATLYYNDIRQFGWIKVVPTDTVKELPFFKELGPEFPLVKKDSSLTEDEFAKILSKTKTSVKVVIMDQKKMSGVGNIYANDSLYLAKIDPKRPANSLTAEEVKSLYKAILEVLQKGLEEGGASELTFVNVLGKPGNYQNHTQVYGHDGEKCKRDGTVIKKITLGGRGTYYCPTCQI